MTWKFINGNALKGWLRLALENAGERADKNEECLLSLMMHVSAMALPRAFSGVLGIKPDWHDLESKVSET